jgi:hypothetical protein
MIMNQGRDTSRIGGGISEIVEQSVAGSVFNWWVQLYTVFYDVKHFGSVMGIGKATEYAELSAKDIDRQLIIEVSENSMKPKDEVSKTNQAMELYKGGAIGPKVLLETLDFPNPDESAADGALWHTNPASYIALNFPELAQKLQAFQQQQMAAQQQAQQQQIAQEGQAAQAQTGQQLQQSDAVHKQKLQQSAEVHGQKLAQAKESASAKLAQVKLPK